MTAADELRAAADRIKRLASSTTLGLWSHDGGNISTAHDGRSHGWVGDHVGYTEVGRDADWICALSPAVAPELVEWLRAEADQQGDLGEGEACPGTVCSASLAFARAVLAAAPEESP